MVMRVICAIVAVLMLIFAVWVGVYIHPSAGNHIGMSSINVLIRLLGLVLFTGYGAAMAGLVFFAIEGEWPWKDDRLGP